LIDRQAGGPAGFFDTTTKQPTPRLAADSSDIFGGKRLSVHILITPKWRLRQEIGRLD
jgi:hypothetical protein